MIAITCKIRKFNTTSTFYIKDYNWQAAKHSINELQMLHGAENVSVNFIDDYCMSYEELWRKDWSRL